MLSPEKDPLTLESFFTEISFQELACQREKIKEIKDKWENKVLNIGMVSILCMLGYLSAVIKFYLPTSPGLFVEILLISLNMGCLHKNRQRGTWFYNNVLLKFSKIKTSEKLEVEYFNLLKIKCKNEHWSDRALQLELMRYADDLKAKITGHGYRDYDLYNTLLACNLRDKNYHGALYCLVELHVLAKCHPRKKEIAPYYKELQSEFGKTVEFKNRL